MIVFGLRDYELVYINFIFFTIYLLTLTPLAGLTPLQIIKNLGKALEFSSPSGGELNSVGIMRFFIICRGVSHLWGE